MPEGTIRNHGIGGAAVANPDFRFINYVNPATLVYNRLVSFEGGLYYQNKTIRTSSESQSANGAVPSYGILAFPISKKWTSSIGIRPKSIINFERRYAEPIEGDSTSNLLVIEEGQGGVNTVFLGNGVKISDNFSIGTEFSFGFGRREVGSTFGLNFIDNSARNVLNRRENLRGFGYKFGAYYQLGLDSAKKTTLGIGLVFDGQENYNSDILVSRQFTNGVIIAAEDTFDNADGDLVIPYRLRFGIGLRRANNWSASLDIEYSPWTAFNSSYSNPNGVDLVNYKFGIEWIPNYRSVNNIFARTIYRLGAYYKPFEFDLGTGGLNEFGMNIGLSLPINKINFLNLSVGAGRRGTLENNLILENFARISFGLTINDPSWFRRYKLD